MITNEVNCRIPKKIKLIVNKGEDLQLYHPKRQIKHQPEKWRVLILGVIEKLATAKVNSETGNPEWLCEISVTAKNAQDPISLLVTDSKGRHIGQVLIPLSQIPPIPLDCKPGSRPPLVFSNIHKSELEPTNKNSYPKGSLYYWLWAEEYWKLEEIIKMKTKKSLSRSMHDLSNSTLNLFRRRKSTTSFQESELSPNNIRGRASTDISLRASPLKVNNLKKMYKPDSDSSSSMISQGMIRSGTRQSSPVMNGIYPKNPFDAMITTDISIENHITQEEPYQPESNKPKQGLFTKFRFMKSRSSVDLTNISGEGGPIVVPYQLPQSLGKQQGHRLIEDSLELSKSSRDIPYSNNYNIPLTNNRISSRRMNRPQSCCFHNNSEQIQSCNKSSYNNYSDGNHSHNHSNKSNTFTGNFSLYNAEDTPITIKNKEVMNKRELLDLITYLENQLKVTSDHHRTIERNSIQLNLAKKDLHDELSSVKDELCRLKCKLLEAGDTKYLEKTEPKSRSEVLSDLAMWRKNSKI